MGVKHRGERHISVIRSEPADGFVTSKHRGKGDCMEDELTMREVDPFGKSCCSRGIEYRGTGVFIEIGKFIGWRCVSQHLFVFDIDVQLSLRFRVIVGEEDDFLHRRQFVPDRLEEGEKFVIDHNDIVFGVVHRIDDLIG